MTTGATFGMLSGQSIHVQTKGEQIMSDTRRRYRAISDGLMQALHHPSGHQASHVQTLALLICSMLGAMHSHLPRIATHAPALGRLRSSLIQRFTNWYRNHVITRETYYNPIITPLLVGLATRHTALRVVLDGSAVGTNMVVLMANVVYRGRSIPIAWKVVRGKKGHWPTWGHLDVLRQVHAVMPSWASVIVLGDGNCSHLGGQTYGILTPCQQPWKKPSSALTSCRQRLPRCRRRMPR
jgi:hypothetical protein